jgi:hypothetical protein
METERKTETYSGAKLRHQNQSKWTYRISHVGVDEKYRTQSEQFFPYKLAQRSRVRANAMSKNRATQHNTTEL